MTSTSAESAHALQVPLSYDVEQVVRHRYEQGARSAQPALCCPTTEYDTQFLKVLPEEILTKDYGCGNPTKHVRTGETVVDLGSGAGKICYILSQQVGPTGHVIGVDFNDEMLDLARRHQASIAAKIGHSNVRFLKGRIQDLALNLDLADAWLRDHPIGTVQDLADFEAVCERLRVAEPMIPTGSSDVVVSNCVLNLVKPAEKEQLFSELFRVLKRGGRAVISDIVSDEDPTPQIRNDPELWSGCIAGVFREDAFLAMFEASGFYGIEILARSTAPWRTIDGIEFRSMTVRAYKGKQGPCLERQQAVMYKGPWRSVTDDDGHVLHRARRMAVCDKTFKILNDPSGPYHANIDPVPPRSDVPLDRAAPFACQGATFRHPRQTKGQDYHQTTEPEPSACCATDECC